MKFVQYYLDCLSHASYLIGDESTGQAVVVDPRRDIGDYLDDAATAGMRVAYVIETHVHADFVSGHLELADATGATIIYGEAADVHVPHRKAVDGDRIALGDVVLEFRATPGHTPESISVVVWATHAAATPDCVLTGDTLFIGDVGRPDLCSSTGRNAHDMARQLHRSLHGRLLTLPDDTRVYPAHGAGSACGKNLSTATVSTIGEQRRTNYALQLRTVGEFVHAVTQGQPPPPDYFAHVTALNRDPHQLARDDHLPYLSLDDIVTYQARGAVVLDVRSPDAFARAHLPGSLNVGLEGRFAEHASDVAGVDDSIVLVCEHSRAHEARVRLSRVGLDAVIGALEQPAAAFAHHPDIIATARRLTTHQLAAARHQIADLVLLDVRGHGERANGYIENSTHIPIGQLRRRANELDPTRPLVAYCAGGYRSSIAASLLRAHAFHNASDLTGGYQAWTTR